MSKTRIWVSIAVSLAAATMMLLRVVSVEVGLVIGSIAILLGDSITKRQTSNG